MLAKMVLFHLNQRHSCAYKVDINSNAIAIEHFRLVALQGTDLEYLTTKCSISISFVLFVVFVFLWSNESKKETCWIAKFRKRKRKSGALRSETTFTEQHTRRQFVYRNWLSGIHRRR